MSQEYKPGPASLFVILAREEEQCCCFEFIGDNPQCLKHSVRVQMKDGRLIPGVIVHAELKKEEDDAR